MITYHNLSDNPAGVEVAYTSDGAVMLTMPTTLRTLSVDETTRLIEQLECALERIDDRS